MSAPVVVIGWILLIPSLLGMALALIFCGFGMLFAGSAGTVNPAQPVIDQLVAEGIPQDIAKSFVEGIGKELDANQKARLTPEQQKLLANFDLPNAMSAAILGQGMAATGGVISSLGALCGAISCFVSGLLGWLLIMKKTILQCGHCGATVNAS